MNVRTIWGGRPYSGLAWRPQDLSISLVAGVWTAGGLFITYHSSWLPFGLMLSCCGYALVGRFYHDAALRRRIRYELTSQGLAVWIDGRDAPECLIDIFQLRHVRPQFVTGSGRGTIELPPAGWAAQPAWVNRWDRLLPAIYPCRRVELIEDVEAVAALFREQAAASLATTRQRADGPLSGNR